MSNKRSSLSDLTKDTVNSDSEGDDVAPGTFARGLFKSVVCIVSKLPLYVDLFETLVF